jgi:hypothetical protein
VGQAPGAGGGGAGAIGDGAVGGEGGGGGEIAEVYVSAEELRELRNAGLARVEYDVGRGGKGATGDGEDGEDTVVRFVTSEGKVLKSIRVRGGKGGKMGTVAQTPDPSAREADFEDLAKGLHVSSVHVADCVHIRDGLLYLLGADWENYAVPNLPFEIQWPFSCTLSMGKVEPGTLLEMFAVVVNPSGNQVVRQSFIVSSGEPRRVARSHSLTALRFTATSAGIWSIQIISGKIEFAHFPIEIKLPSH